MKVSLKNMSRVLVLVAIGLIGAFFTGSADHANVPFVNVPGDLPVPAVSLQLNEYEATCWNLKLDLSNFRLTPPYVNQDPVPGEGHAHLYIDGVKKGRIYDEWAYLGHIHPGLHEIRVTLNANSHADWALNDMPIEDVVILNVADDGHMHRDCLAHLDEHAVEHGIEVSGFATSGITTPSIFIELTQDAMSGWNLHLFPRNFFFAPEGLMSGNIYNQGHAVLAVDGHPVSRIYGEWHHFSGLEKGEHHIEVMLATNMGGLYMMNGKAIAAHQKIDETREDGSIEEEAHDDGDHDDGDHK